VSTVPFSLTPRQLGAVSLDRRGKDWCVVAGPGSGKTSVLIEYFRRLVESGVPPRNILAITFTEKAASNIRRRLSAAFAGSPDLLPQIERAQASTLDAFCAGLLREYAIQAGVDPQFRIVEDRESVVLRNAAVREALDALFEEREPEAVALMRGMAAADLAGAMADVHDAIRASGLRADALPPPVYDPEPLDALIAQAAEVAAVSTSGWRGSHATAFEECREWARRVVDLRGRDPSAGHFQVLNGFPKRRNLLPRRVAVYEILGEIDKELLRAAKAALVTGYYVRERETLLRAFLRFDDIYNRKKRAAGALDFGDLEESAARLLEDSSIRGAVRERYPYILMDEFQDTNRQQEKLLRLLRAPDSFYAVGDINQSIYGFRHADPEVFREYREEVRTGGKNEVELRENFRSRPEILRAVERMFDGAPGIEAHELLPGRIFDESTEPAVEVIAAVGEDSDAAAEIEAGAIARRILELDRPYPEIAILARNSASFEALSAALDAADIPCVVTGGRGFFETREVRDLTHLLRVLVNQRDEISMAAVLRSPFAGVSEEAMLRLKQIGNLGAALRRLDACGPFDPADLARLEIFRERLDRWRRARDYTPPDALLSRAMDECCYEPPRSGRVNAEKFLAMARAAGTRETLPEFVEELELLRATDVREVEAATGEETGAVRMMTVHAAKGLEFPVVFLAGMNKGVSTEKRALSFSPEGGLGARWTNPAERTEHIGDSVYEATSAARKKSEEDESNRLLYVAMTRAESKLVLSYAAEGKPKEWVGMVERAFGLDPAVGEQRVLRLESPRGEPFSVLASLLDHVPPYPPRGFRAAAPAAAPEIIQVSPVPGPRDSSVNVTSVALHAACPRRYYLARYLGWERRKARAFDAEAEPPEPHESNASEFGREVHALLSGNAPEDGRKPGEAAVRLAANFQTSNLGKRAARARRAEREFDFLFALDGVVLRGQIDLWFEDAAGLVLVDYKTDEVPPGLSPAEHASCYALQLQLYAHALEKAVGRVPDEAWIYLLRPNVAAPADLSPLSLYGAACAVRDLIAAQETCDFPMKIESHCKRCPFYRGLCPAEL
jgi:ATP-dependent exoDNAse (exonuclease V) beta subunit